MSVHAEHQGRAEGLVLGVSEAERQRAFRAARRHSVLVRTLKIALPIATVGVLSLYFIPAKLSFEFGGATASVDNVAVEAGNLKMENPTLSGVHPSYGRYEIKAESAIQNIESPHMVNLNAITGKIISPKGETTRLHAPAGLFDTKARHLTFGQGVNIEGRDSLSVELKSATVAFSDQKISSREPVSMAFRGSRIDANAIDLYTGEARVVFTGQVRVRLDPRQQTESE